VRLCTVFLFKAIISMFLSWHERCTVHSKAIKGGIKIEINHLVKMEKLLQGVAIIVIDRPKVKNAINKSVITQLKHMISSLENDQDVSVVILKGNEENFIAGADINEMVGVGSIKAYEFASEMKSLHDMIIHSKKPYIAAIEGYCLGGGLELALACDIRLVDSTAKLGLPEINLGIIPGGGGIQRLFEIIGTSLTSQLVMSGEIIDGNYAANLKIARLVEGKSVGEEARELANNIASKSNVAISSLKRLVNTRNYRENKAGINEDILEFSLLFDHPDSLEGMSAFLQKRRANFNGGVRNGK